MERDCFETSLPCSAHSTCTRKILSFCLVSSRFALNPVVLSGHDVRTCGEIKEPKF